MDKERADTPGIGEGKPPNNGKKARLLSLADLDGRTNAAKWARSLVADLESDLGGAERLSAAEREIVQRCALASAMLQDMEATWLTGRGVDVAAYTTLANSQSRMLKMIGLARRPRDVTPDLDDYVASRAPAAPVIPPPPVPPRPGSA